jgi:hypothetical protein
MGNVHSITQSRRAVLLLLSGILALLTVLLLTFAVRSESAEAQISPLSPLPVATSVPENQPQIVATATTSPLPLADNIQSSVAEQSSTEIRDLNQAASDQQLIPLGEPSEAQPSLILVGALLVGLGLFAFAVLTVRRRG